MNKFGIGERKIERFNEIKTSITQEDVERMREEKKGIDIDFVISIDKFVIVFKLDDKIIAEADLTQMFQYHIPGFVLVSVEGYSLSFFILDGMRRLAKSKGLEFAIDINNSYKSNNGVFKQNIANYSYDEFENLIDNNISESTNITIYFRNPVNNELIWVYQLDAYRELFSTGLYYLCIELIQDISQNRIIHYNEKNDN